MVKKISEYQFHKFVVGWLDASLPDGCFFHHSPNEGKKHINYHVKMKTMGMKSGFPDLCLFVPTRYFWNGTPCSIFLELKRPGGRATPIQKEVHKKLEDTGAAVAVIDNISKLKIFLSNLIELKENSQAKLIERMLQGMGA
ncbi:MAG: hypothetical protein Unbinned2189contig1000_7 [Prokaryotic dsDNA virus sp.]|nr:MAG: hypothetical protein Unbinned2189contig1000_7 [Prokaryotic dsDNA virus sp.]|tara:strand:- start:78 stop:500 length:423 start_codon:yes stop_codon:yes gene_type:complete